MARSRFLLSARRIGRNPSGRVLRCRNVVCWKPPLGVPLVLNDHDRDLPMIDLYQCNSVSGEAFCWSAGTTGQEGDMKQKVAIALLFLGVSLRPAAADLMDECRGRPWPDVQLRACTEIIASPRFDLDAKALAYRYRGDARTDAGAFQAAIADFSESIQLRPDNVPALAGRARAEFSIRNFAEALGDYNEAIR